MTAIDKSEKITIDGKDYTLLYTTRALLNVEKECTAGSLIELTADRASLLKLQNVLVMFKYGMLAGNKDLSAADIEELFDKAVEEMNGYIPVGIYCMAAMVKSGFIAKAEPGKKPEEEEEKKEEAPEQPKN